MDKKAPKWARYGMYRVGETSCRWTGKFYRTEQEAEEAERNLGNGYFAICRIQAGEST